MGLRFRKSVNIGGFRINLSKSGVGYSFGAMGVRYTKKANGGNRITSSIKGTGISYVKDFSNNNKKNAKSLQQDVYQDDIEETGLVQSSSNELVEKLNMVSKKNNRNKIINICLGIVAFYLFYYMVSVNAWCAIPLIGVLVTIGILCKKRYVVLNYDFSNMETFYNALNQYIKN